MDNLTRNKENMDNLTRNKENKGKKRPVCACGTEMTYVAFKGYYDEREFWICENSNCKTEDGFKPDKTDKGCYA